MHAVSHSLTHRGPTASRTRARWQPYSSIPTTTTARSPSSAYLNTPATTVSTPASLSQLPLCEQDLLKSSLASSLSHTQKEQLREVHHKVRYVNGLVDIAVKSLGEIWNPHDIPFVYTPASTSLVAQPSTPVPPPNNGHSITQVLATRYTQLPSPPVSPNHLATPSPLPFATPTPRPVYLADASTTQNRQARSTTAPLKGFVHEVLRRSRTSCAVLQTALCYLEAVRSKVPEIVRQEKAGTGVRGEVDQSSRIIQADDPAASSPIDDVNFEDFIDASHFVNPESYFSDVDPPTVRVLDDNPLATPVVPSWQAPQIKPLAAADASRKSSPRTLSTSLPALPPLPSPLLCPRRTFLASLILASKFTQDKCYSNRAWAKLAGLPAREIGRCERALGEALEWRLWVGKLPPQRTPLLRSRSDGDIFAPGNLHGAAPAPYSPSDYSALGSTPGTSMPLPANSLRRHCTMPSSVFQPQVSQDTYFPPAPIHPAGPTVPFAATMQGPWMPLPPPTPIAVEQPQDVTMWASAMPAPASSVSSDYSPTPTLTSSPATTDASDGLAEDRTIQMSSFIDAPEPTKGAPVATYAYASGMGLGPMGEGGITQWDGVWTASANVGWNDVRY